jgi:photosystem II stability/assembly factor-like uncharacterized protein
MRRLLAILLFAAASSWAGIGQWTSLGGPEGGNIAMLAIDPNTADTIYAARRDGSTFKSIDGGARWTVTDFPIGRLIIDPNDSQTIYVVTPKQGFFKSSDGGATWRGANSGLTGYGRSLSFDPQNTQTLYSGVGRQLFKSTDGAETWTAFSSLPLESGDYAVSLAIDPQDPKTLYAAQSGFFEADTPRFYRSRDGGTTWTRIPAADDLMSFGTLIIDPKSPSTLYVGACSGISIDYCDYWTIFKSVDRGDSWTLADSGLPLDSYNLVAIDPQNPATLYATSGEALFKTMDGGASWSKMITQLVAYTVSNLAIDPRNGGTLYAATSSGVWKSTDAGINWKSANAGLSATAISILALDAVNEGTLYAVDRDGISSLFKSTNVGATWTSLNSGLHKRSEIWKLIVDPSDGNLLYAIVRTLPSSDSNLFKSTDGGVSWNPANSGLSGFNYDVAVDPVNEGTFYVSSYENGEIGLGIYKTTDGGISWNHVGPGPVFSNLPRPVSLMVDPQNPTTIYASNFGQVWKSMDGGATFTSMNVGLPFSPCYQVGNVRTFAIDPQDSSTLYAWTEMCHESAMPGFFVTVNSGFFKSTNGGLAWEQAGPALPDGVDGTAILIDPWNSSIMYTLSGGGDVFRSTDGGANWTPLTPGKTTQWFAALAMDLRDPKTLYAGTAGGGVFAITLVD